MNHFSKSLWMAAFACAGALHAQNTFSTEAKQSYTSNKNNILKAAEKMPEADYSFRPTPDVRPFGALVAHVADAQIGICSGARGEQKKLDAASKTSKADLVAALKASFDYCDAVYDGATDEMGKEMGKLFGRDRSNLGILYGNVIHNNEMYGTMAVYLRLKGIVPPSSDRPMGNASKAGK